MVLRIAIVLLVSFMAVNARGQELEARVPAQVAVEGRLVRATVVVDSMPAASALNVQRLSPSIADGRIEVDVVLNEILGESGVERTEGLLQVVLPDVPPGRYEFSMQVTLVDGDARTVVAEVSGLQTAVSDADGPSIDPSDPTVMLSAGDGEWDTVEVSQEGPGMPSPVQFQFD